MSKKDDKRVATHKSLHLQPGADLEHHIKQTSMKAARRNYGGGKSAEDGIKIPTSLLWACGKCHKNFYSNKDGCPFCGSELIYDDRGL